MRYLTKFLTALCHNKDIRSSQILFDFVSIEDESVFQQKKKEYSKIKPIARLNEMSNTEGEVNLIKN